jgi:hypothetical protein
MAILGLAPESHVELTTARSIRRDLEGRCGDALADRVLIMRLAHDAHRILAVTPNEDDRQINPFTPTPHASHHLMHVAVAQDRAPRFLICPQNVRAAISSYNRWRASSVG